MKNILQFYLIVNFNEARVSKKKLRLFKFSLTYSFRNLESFLYLNIVKFQYYFNVPRIACCQLATPGGKGLILLTFTRGDLGILYLISRYTYFDGRICLSCICN